MTLNIQRQAPEQSEIMVANNTVANTQQKRLSIGIVGGGIGGVAFAVALSRDSHLDVQLFEAAPQFSEIGAGVSFGPNAVKAIQRLGLEASYQRIADSSPAPFEDVWFEWRRGSDDAYLTASFWSILGTPCRFSGRHCCQSTGGHRSLWQALCRG